MPSADRTFALTRLHLRALVLVLVVIADQMQRGVRGEKAHLPLERVPVFLCLRLCARHGKDDVAQQRGQLRGAEVEHRERKHIGCAVDAAVFPIVTADGFIVAEEDVQFKCMVGVFRLNCRAYRFFYFFQKRTAESDAGSVLGMDGDHFAAPLSSYFRLNVRAGVCARAFWFFS